MPIYFPILQKRNSRPFPSAALLEDTEGTSIAVVSVTEHYARLPLRTATLVVEALEKLDCGPLGRCQQGRFKRVTMISLSGVAARAGAVA